MIGTRAGATAVIVLLLAGTAGAQETTVTKPETAARAFVALLASGDFTGAETKLDTTMRRLLPAPRLAETWAAVQAQAGAFRAQHGVTVTQVGRYTVAAVT